MGASVANAGFVISSTREDGSGGNAGFDVIKFFAKNDGLDGTGTQLQSVDITLSLPTSPNSNLKVDFRDIDFDGEPDANVLGGGAFPIANPPGTYIRVGGAASFNTATAPPNANSDPDADGVPNRQPSQDPFYTNLKTLRVAGFNPTAPAATTGLGAQFAAAVVPDGVTVLAAGGVAGTTGAITPVSELNAVPEPATIGLLGLGVMSMMGRRRRA
jgi:hypothetical protein